jgi:hypothetical protein
MHALCNEGTASAGPQMGYESAMGFSPCTRHRPAIGKRDGLGLAGAKAHVFLCFGGGPAEAVPLLQDGYCKTFREI